MGNSLLNDLSTKKPVNTGRPHVSPGMPPLDSNGRATTFFEFWPTWLMYLPVVVQWLLLSVWHRSLSLPLIANPAIPLSGMVGVAKSAVFDVAGADARRWILPWTLHQITDELVEVQCQSVMAALASAGLGLPIVGKPEIGCRGVGVKLLQFEHQLKAYLASFPAGGWIQFQQLSEWDAEAGVFYVREPDASRGEVTSLTLKYIPYVVGDGCRTLGELVAAEPRAGELLHLYRNRHGDKWQSVIAAGEPYRLIFAASHSRGAVFRDANRLITTELSQALDRIFDDIPGFYYGRLDVKFKDLDSLLAGKDFVIIEINGASSESIGIWDRNAGFWAAILTLLRQYNTLFKLGRANRRRGHKSPGLLALLKAWRFENQLVKQYPEND
ncbi:MAG: hypothetical protein MK319_02550 [Pseudomonadales bacterium]|nr:hypothetical protein [Pseudomonadales bacterium]